MTPSQIIVIGWFLIALSALVLFIVWGWPAAVIGLLGAVGGAIFAIGQEVSSRG